MDYDIEVEDLGSIFYISILGNNFLPLRSAEFDLNKDLKQLGIENGFLSKPNYLSSFKIGRLLIFYLFLCEFLYLSTTLSEELD